MADVFAWLLSFAEGSWWRPLFVPGRALTFASMFVTGVPTEEWPLVRYAAGNFFHGFQPLIPPPGFAANRPGELPYVDGQSFLTSIEGSTFLAFDAPAEPFFLDELAVHLERDYALAFLLATYQRFALIEWLRRLSAGAANASEEADRFLSFATAGYDLQAVQREHHHRYFESCRAALQIDSLYDNVRAVVEAMRMRTAEETTALARERETREARLAVETAARDQKSTRDLQLVVVLALAVPTATLGLLGVNIDGVTTSSHGVSAAAAAGVGAAMIALLLGLIAWIRRAS
jgi:hypothetical protein